jgi:hypothetical protein
MSMLFKKNIDKSKSSPKKEIVNKSNILPKSNLDFVKVDDSKSKQMINLKLNLNTINLKGIWFYSNRKGNFSK